MVTLGQAWATLLIGTCPVTYGLGRVLAPKLGLARMLTPVNLDVPTTLNVRGLRQTHTSLPEP